MCEIETFKYFFLLFLQVVGKTSFTVCHIFHTKKTNVCSVLSDRPNNLTERILYLFVYRVGVVNQPLNFLQPWFLSSKLSPQQQTSFTFWFSAQGIFFYFYFFFVGHQYNQKIGLVKNQNVFLFFFLFCFGFGNLQQKQLFLNYFIFFCIYSR